MKISRVLIHLTILFILSSCRTSQVEKSIQEHKGAYGSITITPSDISSGWVNMDTLHALMSGNDMRPGFGPTTTFRIYLPFPDSLELSVSNVKDSLIYVSPVRFLSKGQYKFDVLDLHIEVPGVYLLKAAFCDSVFVRKFIYIK